jgi:transcriptional regulator with XRE-family HTH domain
VLASREILVWQNASMGKVKTNFKTKRRTFIKAWRLDRKLTLEKLAERIGVTAGALSQLERGEVAYTQPMLEALASELRCDPADLITRDPAHDAGIMLVWSWIPEADRPRALNILKELAKAS